MTPTELRLAILRKHARLGPNGQPSLCTAQRGARAGGKVIFRSEAAAERAAAELNEWAVALRQSAYRCPAFRHFHLTKAVPPSGGDR